MLIKVLVKKKEEKVCYHIIKNIGYLKFENFAKIF